MNRHTIFRHLIVALLGISPLGAQTVNPADFGTISLHLKADDLTLANNAPVTTWGSLATATDNAPTYVASDARFNNKPVVRFDGADDFLFRAAANTKARTIFVVGTMESGSVSLATLISTGQDKLDIRRDGTAARYRGPGANADTNDFTTSGTVQVNQVAGGMVTYGSPHLLLQVASSQKTYGDFYLGNAGTSTSGATLTRYWNGSIAEVIVYDGVLTTDGINHVGWYLQNKYALPTTYPSPAPAATLTASVNGITSGKGVLSTSGTAVTLAWTMQNGTSVSIDNGALATTSATSGSVTVSPTVTTTYTLAAINSYGTTTIPVTVTIGGSTQPTTINEFLASNSGGYRDEDGDSSDWIEIYNPNPYAIDLNGYQLKDSNSTWIFPAGSIIEATGYRLVFPSSKNRNNPAGNLHTNFGLSANGEILTLLTPGGATATAFTPGFPAQRANVSMGLESGVQVFYANPTPLAPNDAPSSGLVADIAFSSARGFYTASFPLTLTCATPGATIRYTTDSTTPTLANGTTYSGPITISATTTLRAAAFLTGWLPTPAVTQTYLFLDDVLANQVYATGTAPSGWPTTTVNGQTFRYGWNTVLKAQYTNQQLLDGLKQIPSISIVTDQANLTNASTGIYVNADLKGDDWERQATAEYLPADGSTKFYVNAGLRIRGGASRGDSYVKHSLRLHFRGEYGDSSLVFPLHGTTGTDEFETLDLRTEQNYHWSLGSESGRTENTAVREVFCRDLQTALGQPTTRSRYLHLYLNGQYWGIYQTEERAQEDYGASYFGGDKDDYDVIQTSNHPNFTYELSSGTITAWQTLWNMARAHQANPTAANYFAILGRNPDGTRNPALPVYLDADNLISYMLLHYYTGDGDGPLSNFLGMNRANNWRGMRNRNTADGFRFFVHDAEHTLNAPSWVANRANTSAPNGSNRGNFTYSNPEWIHEDLSANPEYRIRMADLAQKFLFNGGPMTQATAQALFDARAAQINQAIIPDAARWGTNATNHTLAQWQNRLAAIRTSFFASRETTLISQLRTRGFFPSVNAPTFAQRGGQVAPNYQLVLSQGVQTGAIYYTTDGSDPRAIGGAIAGTLYASPGITLNGLVTVRARFLSDTGVWSALDEATFSALAVAAPGNLVVTKIHYRPTAANAAETTAGYTGSSDFEYVELMNISAASIDVRGVQVQNGITFNFASSTISTLQAGARMLVVGNTTAFPFRYGSGLPVAGQYGGSLSNSGETVRVANAADDTIASINYGIASPWPAAANGTGAAMVLKNPFANPNQGLGVNWRASYNPGGNPGLPDLQSYTAWRTATFAPADLSDPAKETIVWGDHADPDGDGLSNLAEFATGGSPLGGNSRYAPAQSVWTDPNTSQRYLTLTCRLNGDSTGIAVAAVAGSDLTAWPVSVSPIGSPVLQPDGGYLQTWRDPLPYGTAAGGKRFMRLVFSR
ncbi:lamin tail domain-containing protein [Luteolibacter ambystomatis]|uniref:Lamin tail domain-containing protein n=1 Tax=Luteolibacter ambystomatis TaxID=2824561 RepID=A0A975PGY2_9BACT|nr:lamin tail domain-containing protein [Luteolibacter ambystomatis]QUE52767.1 lamin tail domain-containing protein [Luteolibacter ambystomatis]